jgi:hypothetical protein
MMMAQIIVCPIKLVIRYEQSYEIFHEYHQCLFGLYYIIGLYYITGWYNIIPFPRSGLETTFFPSDNIFNIHMS